jgi:hypothetical protein
MTCKNGFVSSRETEAHVCRIDLDQKAIEAAMAEAKLDWNAAKDMYTKGGNSLPRTMQGFAKALGDSEASTALPIFKVFQ